MRPVVVTRSIFPDVAGVFGTAGPRNSMNLSDVMWPVLVTRSVATDVAGTAGTVTSSAWRDPAIIGFTDPNARPCPQRHFLY